jgi:hypothetical protein
MTEKLVKKGDGGINKSKAVFMGAFEATPEQLEKKKPGEPPSQASLSLIDRWIAVLEAMALFEEVRAYKSPPYDAEQSEWRCTMPLRPLSKDTFF